ncbi:MAG TPA: hypothetical protein PLR79_08580 [Acinetobacter sp.]|nr:hypothetical protein [Acinetobacter sp.]
MIKSDLKGTSSLTFSLGFDLDQVLVRSNAGVLEISHNGGPFHVPGSIWEDEEFIVDVTIQTTGTLTLLYTPYTKADFIYLNGIKLKRGASRDYTIAGNVVTINNSSTILVIGDEIQVQYPYTP